METIVTAEPTPARRRFTLTLTLPYRCGYCGDMCGHLYTDEVTPKGACLGCKIDAEAVADYERTEADEFWGTAESSWQQAINTLPAVYAVHCDGESERFPSEVDAMVWADMLTRRGAAVSIDRL